MFIESELLLFGKLFIIVIHEFLTYFKRFAVISPYNFKSNFRILLCMVGFKHTVTSSQSVQLRCISIYTFCRYVYLLDYDNAFYDIAFEFVVMN